MSESKADIHSRDASDPLTNTEPLADGAEQGRSNGRSSDREPTVSPAPAGLPPSASETESSLSSDTKPPRPIDDLKDRQLGDFRLLRRIGHGGMAEVYLAEQISLKRNVAVKVLREEMHADAVHLKRFEQEAKAAGGLNHPNIVQVYSIGHEDGVHFIAQEYVPGMNLREYLTRNGPPDKKTAVRFMRQMAAALEAASEAGIVHRDVKPENVLITRKNEVKVTDFGLAQLALGERLNLTQVGMTMGTPLYMSPEQVNGRNVDFRSDIYSLGVTCYHMLCGATPFRGETALSVAIQHVNNEPPPLKQQRPDLPDVICQLVHRMMAKDPDDRYQDAAILVADLERIERALHENPAALARMRLTEAGMPRGLPWWLSPFVGWSLARKIAVFAVLAVIAAGVGAAVGWRERPGDPFEEPPATPKNSVKIESDALSQLNRAFILRDSEDAYKAVIENFPGRDDALYRRLAKEGLALLYVRTRRYDEAKDIFASFTQADPRDTKQKATGYAGLAVVASLQGKYQESQRICLDNPKLLDDRALVEKRLVSQELRELLDAARKRNAEKLGQKSPDQIFRNGGESDGR